LTSTQEFQNDNITVLLTREPGCRAKLEITVTPQATQAAYQKALKTVNKEVSLPGFRKGKAPDQIVIQKYAKFIDQEWHDLLVKTAFTEALDLTETQPLNQQSVKRPHVASCSKEEGSKIVIELETLPEIPEIAPSELSLNPPKRKTITREEIDNAIMDLRLHHSAWTEIADRPVQEGDFVRVDIDNLDDPENPVCKDTHFEVKKGRIAKWMHNLLLGKNKGDVVEGYSEKDKNLSDADHFVKTHCRITINKIETPQLPELDDTLAAKLGLKTIQELDSRVEQDLNRQADEAVQDALRNQVDDALVDKYPIDIPFSLFDAEKKVRMQRISQMKKQLKPEAFEKIADRYSDDKINENVLRTLRLYFITRKIAENHQIEITQDELLQEMMQHIYNPNSSLINPSMNNDEIRSKLYLAILDRKTKDYIIEQVVHRKSSDTKTH